MVLIRTLALLLLTTAPAVAAVFNPITRTLSNGMQVIVIENQRAPVVLHMLWYKVGAADEPADHAGLAHFMEHMMFKGTKEHPDQDFSADVAALGGEDNAFTSYDYTAFFQRIHPSRLADVMSMEAERMADLELDPEDVRVERSVVTQERAQTSTATPQDRFREAVRAAFYGTHPYARPVIGWNSTIAAYSKEALQPYYESHYVPNNAVLVVSGAVKADDVFRLAEETYGNVKPHAVPMRSRSGAIAATPMRLVQTDVDVKQPLLTWEWPAPGLRTAAHNDNDALQVLAEILNTPDGILQTELLHNQKIAVGVSVDYDDSAFDTTDFSVAATPVPGQSLDKVEKSLRILWPRALHAITATDVKQAKIRLIDGAALALDSINTGAYAFGMTLATGGTMGDIEQWPDKIDAVQLADVQRVAKSVDTIPLLAARLEGGSK